MSRSQSDTERVLGKLTKDFSHKRFDGKYDEAYKEKGKRRWINEETFSKYANSVPQNCLPLKELTKEWGKTFAGYYLN